MTKIATAIAIFALAPLILAMDMLEEGLNASCQPLFAYLRIDEIAKAQAGDDVFVRYSLEQWRGDCLFELEGEVLRASPFLEPLHITVVQSPDKAGRPLVSTRAISINLR